VGVVIVAVALAAAFAMGVEIRRLLILAGAVYLPLPCAGAIALLAWKSRSDHQHVSALFCEGVAAELRAGATLRDSLVTAATSVGRDMSALTGNATAVPIGEVAIQISEGFPDIAQEVRLTVLNAATSGSDAADLFDEIGSLAMSKAEIRHEVRVATAPARATALFLVGAPVIYVTNRLSSGGLEQLIASTSQRVVTLIGLGLFTLGVLTTALLVWRAGR
jgi:hypothetical protein